MDAGQTIRTLAGKLGLPDDAFDADGRLTIDLGRGAVLHAARIDEDAVEWSAPLADLDYADPAMMALMLEVNCQGTATGAGRLALDGTGGAFFCERWIVRGMDEREAERRFDDLAANALYWLTTGSDELLEKARARQSARTPDTLADADDDGADMIFMRA